jgi:outer membrane protein
VRAKLAILLAVLLSHGPVAAGDNNLRIGARLWHADPGESEPYPANDPFGDIDLNRDPGYRGIRSGTLYLYLEQLLPNAMVGRTDLGEGARGPLSRTVGFGGSRFTTGGDISSRVQYRQSDIILYYNILDTGAGVDVGINARHIDSITASAGSNGGMESVHASGWIPLLYAGVDVELPMTGLLLGADGSFVGYEGRGLYDVTLRASYSDSRILRADLGYRRMKLGLDNFDITSADVEFSGPYAGMYINF